MKTAARTRRAVLASAGGLTVSAFAPQGLRISTRSRRDLWRRTSGPHLRGAVFVQRRVYPDLDGDTFLGNGVVGPPVTNEALDMLAQAGGNLASWSGPGLFSETAPFTLDAQIEDHIGEWLERCLARGLYTTLCFRSGPGRSAFAFHPDESWYPSALYNASIWRDVEKQAAWAEMIAETIRRFGSHRALAGIVPMDEPNGMDLGFLGVWDALAGQIAKVAGEPARRLDLPLIYSPDRWARAEAAPALRQAVGSEAVLSLHHYEPWHYTHQVETDLVRFDHIRMGVQGFEAVDGDWAVLEFGAVRHAPDVHQYLRNRIDRWECNGANWAAFRWTTGWSPYEESEASMTASADRHLLAVMVHAFNRNTRRPA